MAVKRIVPDLHAAEPGAGRAFYEDVLGLELVMDLGWIVTYAAPGERGGAAERDGRRRDRPGRAGRLDRS